MTEAEIQTLHDLLSEFRKENKDDHTMVFSLIAGLAQRQDKMNGGLGTLKWVIAFVLTITVPLLAVIVAHNL